MKPPRLGLSARLTLLTVTLVLFCQAINVFILVSAEQTLRRERFEAVAAERVAQAARFADLLVGPGRRILRRRGVRIEDGPPPEGGEAAPGAEEALQRSLTEVGFTNSQIRARLTPFADGRQQALELAVELPSGNWLWTRQPMPPATGVPWGPIILQTAILSIVLVIPAIWIGRAVGQPLRQLTAATEGFLSGGEAPPLPKGGPPDIEALCSAFAALEERILAALEEKSAMLGAIGHDLRTPLASLRIRVESVSDDKLRTEMIRSIDGLGDALDDILSFSQTSSRNAFEEIRTGVLLRELRRSYDEETLTIVEGPEASLLCAPQSILRALRNLIDNAHRYAGNAELAVDRRGGETAFLISDRGPGIPEDKLDEYQKPFARAEGSRNRRSGGAGLGLAIVRAIAEAHQGRLVLENRAGGGLEAKLVIPEMRPSV